MWSSYRAHFESNQRRPLPAKLNATVRSALPPEERAALIWSLARFQLGETGEGRIVQEIRRVRIACVDEDYRVALGAFIREEGRHARILADVVRALGGTLLRASSSQWLFQRARRLLGVRLKLLVLMAAEVIAAAFYALLAARVKDDALRAILAQIAGDERVHLEFHRSFFWREAAGGAKRALFLLSFLPLAALSAGLVLLEHRRTLAVFGLTPLASARSLLALLELAIAPPPRTRRLEAAAALTP